MNTIGFTSNYTNYSNYSNKISNTNRGNRNLNFKGALGDKFVEEIASGKHVKTDTIMDSLQGTFGLAKNKVADVMDSFAQKITELTIKNSQLEVRAEKQTIKIKNMTVQNDTALKEAKERKEDTFSQVINRIDKKIVKKDARLEKLEKYQSMANVRSIADLDIVQPEVAVQTLNQMVENREGAARSTLGFLLSKESPSEAFQQIKRNNTINKAQQDEITNIDVVAKAMKRANDNGLKISTDSNFAIDMMGTALKGWNHADSLRKPEIRNQIKENAMTMLSYITNKNNVGEDAKSLGNALDKTIGDAREFRKNFKAGKKEFVAQTKKLKRDYVVKDVEVPFDTANSKIQLVNASTSKVFKECSYDELAMMGKNLNK